ncbi:isoprenylcysteine carboxylmethyltransferase family protein [Tepidamorphus sp. 3E244]|uniref:isoprenylcysteine carboxylmethyltransferase family protein n=1 Tax=Tepidamorphus sp. 3E244 TaxID=3385498 RepID=UPI0038FD2D75
MPEFLGWPQIAALLVLAQRGLEELHSARNTRRLKAEGAREAGADYYPVVAATHLGWIAAIFLLIPATATVQPVLAAVYLLLQGVRCWVIGTLGRFWTHRIYTLDAAPIERRGPYAHIRHPNYWVTNCETALLPLVFGAVWVALIFTAIWVAVIRYKIVLEDAALAERRAAAAAP